MGTALVVILGILAVTVVCIVGDYFTKTKLAELSHRDTDPADLEKRIELLEKRIADQDGKIAELEQGVSFTNRLLEEKELNK